MANLAGTVSILRNRMWVAAGLTLVALASSIVSAHHAQAASCRSDAAAQIDWSECNKRLKG